MDTIIRLKIKKDIDSATQNKILKLKGILIANSFTEIIHITDDGEEFHINSFITVVNKRTEVIEFIANYLNDKYMGDDLVIL